MKNKLVKLFRYLITLSVVIAATVLLFMLWHNYTNTPWTRDGRVRADITLVAPDVSGMVEKVYVKDNQYVHKGDKLFEIDTKRFEENIARLKAIIEIKKAHYMMKKSEYEKRADFEDNVLSKDTKDHYKFQLLIAQEELNEAKANLKVAQIDLNRATLYAPVDGWVSNLLLKKGDYIKTAESQIAIINDNSFWVYGYFEEFKIPKIHEGDKAVMNMLGTDYVIKGHVQSIANGISDRDNNVGEGLLANVNPSFTWIRLAQRIPVRIEIDSIPEGFTLRAGMTCTIKIEQ